MTAQRAAIFYGSIICLCYALIPTFTFPTPPLDVVEGFAWGRELELGYTKHPPMQAWLLELTYQISGGHQGAYWLSAAALGIGFYFIWCLSRQLGLTAWQAFWAIVLTSVTFYFTLPMPEFNPNILQIPVWTGMLFFFQRALKENRLTDWVLLGALAAFGLYTKYFVLLIIGAIGLYTLVFADARKYIFSLGPWVCALICALLLVPHIIWLLDTDFLTIEYAASRGKPAASPLDHVINPLNFLAAQIGNHVGIVLVLAAGLGLSGLRTLKTNKLTNLSPRETEEDRFLLWFASIPLIVVLLASAITGNEFEHMWGTPMFVLSGIFVVRLLNLPDLWPSPKRALLVACSVQAIFLGVILGQGILEPYWKTKQTRIHYPGRAIALELERLWEQETGTQLKYVAGDMWSAANVSLFASQRPSMFYLHSQELSPWIDIDDVNKHGVLIVWRGDRATPLNEILQYYPNAKRDGSRTFPYQAIGNMPDAKINWTIIPSGKVATELK